MARYWTTNQILNQVSSELGLNPTLTVVNSSDVQTLQLLAMLNSVGNELLLYYPWEQFRKEWNLTTVAGQGEYALPDDWDYALDQTQWDRSNHWPLIGPKTAQEWAWLKGGLLAAAPRIRYRIYDNKYHLWPVPGVDQTPGVFNLSLEYITRNWVATVNELGMVQSTDMSAKDNDVVQYDPWLVIKAIKMKFYELKGFELSSVQADFMRVFNALTGKDTGAPILSLASRGTTQFIGPWSVPDGSWNVGQP